MKKTTVILFTSWLLVGSAVALRADVRETGRDYRPDRRVVGHGEYRRDGIEYRSQSAIKREIRRNEKRIMKIERRIERLLPRNYRRSGDNRRGRFDRRDRTNRRGREIMQLQMEIERLERRNEQLRRTLYY